MDLIVFHLAAYLLYVAYAQDTCPVECRCRLTRIPNLGDTYWVSCNRKNLETIPDLTPLKSVREPIRLDLKINRIRLVKQSNFPPGVNVAMLFFRLNDGIQMEDHAFINMKKSLKFLNIERINLQFQNQFTFLRGLSNLTKLVMSYNEQNKGTLPRGLFRDLGLSSMEELLLHNCDISDIADGAFEGLTSLQILDLTFNKLRSIPMAVRRLPNLKTLKLGLNRIVKIPERSFGGLTYLESLTLRDNLGLSLEEGAFDGLENSLKHLSLRKCGFVDIPIRQIGKLSKLKSLNIGHNPLTSLEKDSLNGSFCLTELDLTETLFPLDPGIFEAQGDCLRGITINSRGLTLIPIQIFQGLKSIGEVNLKGNKIKVLPLHAFGGIPATSLVVSENPLSEIKAGAFSDLRQHLSIGLEKTDITNINFILEYEKNKFREIWFDGTHIPCSCNISKMFDLVEPWTLDGSCFVGDEEHHLKDIETKEALRNNCTEETYVKYDTSVNISPQASANTAATIVISGGSLIVFAASMSLG